jgi:myo-inositol catabolism protein IolC
VGTALIHWPTEQVVKCLVHYHPDDDTALLLEISPPKAMTPQGMSTLFYRLAALASR